MLRYTSFVVIIFTTLIIGGCTGSRYSKVYSVSEVLSTSSPQSQVLLSDCPPQAASVYVPTGLAGVVPGITLEEELVTLLGEPFHVGLTGSGKRQYLYESITPDGIGANIYTSGGEVELIVSWGWSSGTTPNSTTSFNPRTIEDVIDNHGCPDFIFMESLGTPDISDGNYNAGRLVYLWKGMEFTFDGVPLTLTSPSDYTTYFAPISQSEYVEQYAHGDAKAIVTWLQAATWENTRP